MCGATRQAQPHTPPGKQRSPVAQVVPPQTHRPEVHVPPPPALQLLPEQRQVLEEQVKPAGHWWPQAPQFDGSVCTALQPAWQQYSLDVHEVPPLHLHS